MLPMEDKERRSSRQGLPSDHDSTTVEGEERFLFLNWSVDLQCCVSFKCIAQWFRYCCLVAVMSDPMDCSPPGSSVHGIFQARILEWVAISFSKGSSQPRNQIQVSCIAGRFFLYLWATREAHNHTSKTLLKKN